MSLKSVIREAGPASSTAGLRRNRTSLTTARF
jgi:hypothetical protein